jgi:type II secretory pathway component PulK
MVTNASQSGYVALLSVLIVGAIATATGIALLVTSSDSQRSALISQQSKQARALAVACSEEALQVIFDDTVYTGTGNVTLGQGSCSYTVTSTGSTTRTISVTGTVNNTLRKILINVTIGSSNISITSWQDVS